MAHTFTNLLYHVIFSTKDRLPQIDDELHPRLFGYLGGIVREAGGTALIANGAADHAHLLAALPATVAVSDFMRTLKTNSSRWVHETWPARRAFAWQTGYGAFSVSQSNVEPVRRYIAEQEERHRTMTFQEEFVQILRRHGIAFDERYIWE